jgi:hypothetical protein
LTLPGGKTIEGRPKKEVTLGEQHVHVWAVAVAETLDCPAVCQLLPASVNQADALSAHGAGEPSAELLWLTQFANTLDKSQPRGLRGVSRLLGGESEIVCDGSQ